MKKIVTIKYLLSNDNPYYSLEIGKWTMEISASQIGQSLVELLMTIGLCAILLPTLLLALVYSRNGKAQQNQRSDAILLLKSAEEAMRVIRESNWTTISTDGTFHPVQSASTWTLSANSETINGFTRSVVISDVNRDSNGYIATSGGTLDPSTKRIDINVSWANPIPSTITTTLYFTRYTDTTQEQTTQGDYNSGTNSQTQVTDTSGGEVTLGNNNKAKWCSPSFSTATIDLPDGPPVAVAATASAVTNAIPNDVFVATSPNTSNSVKMAYVNVTANTDPPVPTIHGIFTLDSAQYSSSSYIPTGIGINNSFITNDVKYYTSTNGNLYALLATTMSDHEVIVVKIKNNGTDVWQDPVNHIYPYWTYFDTKMYPATSLTLVNNDFETGNISPYTTIINSGVGTNVTTPVHGGGHSAKVTTTKTTVSGVSGGGGCSGGNRIAVTPDTTYSWSSYINAPTSGNTKFKDARVTLAFYAACTGGSALSSTDSTLLSTTGASWTKVTGSANSGSGTYAEIQLVLRSTTSGTTSTAYFDDIAMSATSSTFDDQAPFGYGAISLTILGNTGYIDSGGYLYAFDLTSVDSATTSTSLPQIGCRILLDGYDCKPSTNLDQKYDVGETGASWSDTEQPAHSSCSDGGNIELDADHQLSAVQVGSNAYVYVAVGAGTNPEMDIADVSTPPNTISTLSSNTCGRGTNTGWKVTGNLDFDTKTNTEEAANSVYAKSDGTRAYMSSNGGIDGNNDGIPDSDQFYIIDTTNKSAPKFLSTSSSGNGSVATSGDYNGNSTNIELYPRRALTVLNGDRAIIVGQDGVPNDGIEPQEYQVLNLDTEATPTYCGGLNYLPGFNDLTSVSEQDGDNFVYMVANTSQKQLKIIQGGPDNTTYYSSGTFTSAPIDSGASDSFNRYIADEVTPANTSIQFQFATADAVSGSCSGANYVFTGPDGSTSTYYSSASGQIYTGTPANGYKNPARCLEYKAYFNTTNIFTAPVLNDMTVNYSL